MAAVSPTTRTDLMQILTAGEADIFRMENELREIGRKLDRTFAAAKENYARVKALLSPQAQKLAEERIGAIELEEEKEATGPVLELKKLHDERAMVIANALSKGNIFELYKLKPVKPLERYHRDFRDRMRTGKNLFKEYAREKTKDAFWGAAFYTTKLVTAPVRWTGKQAYEHGVSDERKEKLKRYRKRVIVRIARTRRELERKKKEGKLQLAQFALRFVFQGILDGINTVVDTSKKVVKAVGNFSRTRFIASGIGQRILNTQTAQNITASVTEFKQNNQLYRGVADRIARTPEGLKSLGRGIVSTAEYVGSPVVKVANTSGQVVMKTGKAIGTGVVRAFDFSSKVAKSVPTGLITGAGLVLVTGNPLAFAGGLALGTAVGTAEKIFAASKTDGYARLFQQNGNWRTNLDAATSAKLKNMTNVYSAPSRALRAVNSGLVWGSVGALGAALLGINPAVGLAVGFAGGAGARFIIDNVVGKSMIGMYKGADTFMHKLSKLASAGFVNRALGSSWLIGQMDIFRTKYKGNLGEYLRNEFGFAEGVNLLSLINVGGNFIGAAAYLQGSTSLYRTVFAENISKWGDDLVARFGFRPGALALGEIKTLGNLGTYTANTLKSGWNRLLAGGAGFLNPGTVGGIAGSTLGYLAAGMLGIGGGPAALVASGVGAVIGTAGGLIAGQFLGKIIGGAVGGAISAALGVGTGGVGLILTGAITTITTTVFTAVTQTVFQFFGWKIDGMINNAIAGATDMLKSTMNIFSALMNVSNLAVAGVNADNVIGFLIALMSIASLATFSSNSGGTNIATTEQGTGTKGINTQVLNIDNYSVKLIGNADNLWNAEDVKIVLAALEETRFADADQRKLLIISKTKNDEILFGNDDYIYVALKESILTGRKPADKLAAYLNDVLFKAEARLLPAEHEVVSESLVRQFSISK